MKLQTLGWIVLGLVAPALGRAATGKSASEILTPALRQATVDLGVRLTQAPAAEVPPADLRSPFSPAGFERLTAEESKAIPARTPGAGPPLPPSASADRGATTIAVGPSVTPTVPGSDRELLEQLAGRIPSSGVILFGARSLLVVGGKRYEVGSRFAVTLAGQDYEVQVVAIDRLTFTLRYRGEQYTRPITLR